MTAPPDDTSADTGAIIAALRAERDAALSEKAELAEALAARNSEFGERIEYQAATIDVLKAMSASPGDPQPVFDLIVERARDLCDAYGVTVLEFDGSLLHYRAANGVSDDAETREAFAAMYPRPPTRDMPQGRAILDRCTIRIDDLEADQGLNPFYRGITAKSTVVVPLMRGEVVIGTVGIGSRERGGFSGSQIELLQTFAEQAVIAITSAEMYRALQARTSDLQETLEYQTATSDVLKVISRSTVDLQPVLETLLATAVRLCRADLGTISVREGDAFRVAATSSLSPEYNAFFRGRLLPADRGSITGRTAIEGRIIHIADLMSDPDFALTQVVKRGETALGVPLLREGNVAGVIVLIRSRVQPFSNRQVELVATFADQAVIAIENARLLTEQREALEQQTATAEVLGVINASPGDLAPVFDAILEKAHTLCGVAQGALVMFDGEIFRASATRGLGDFASVLREGFRPRLGSPQDKLLNGEPFVHISDAGDVDDPTAQRGFELAGVRTVLYVAMRKDHSLLGYIAASHKDVRPFSDKQIALLQNFAAQAVIAMENARLLTETREALEQQTATAEVLQVINSSPGNLTPVFDAILEKAMQLCGAAFGSLYTYDGARFLTAAQRGLPPAYAAFRARHPPTRARGGGIATLVETRKPVHGLDLATHEHYRAGQSGVRAMVELGGVRTSLIVPLLKDDALLGCISVYRQEVCAFSDKQIALLESFAAQAVIAMENAQLITEQREALEQQTATAEVLQVINSSPGDLAPVFDAILEKAHHLCSAYHGSLYIGEGEVFRAVAIRGMSDALADLIRNPFRPGPNHPVQRLVAGAPFAEVHDASTIDDPIVQKVLKLAGMRSALFVALRKDKALLGYVVATSPEVRAFGNKHVTLLQNFAAQAVIAMENARLLDQIRQRQAELRATFDNMGDGVVMFDAEHRLAAWNRNFQELLDISDAILAERLDYADYLRLLAERGEFGAEDVEAELARRLGDTDRELRLERTRPDGRVIEVRRNAVPDGGFVLIYSDITERKRSEAEIRAARDAAEAAYRDLKAAQANLIQAEKMASLGQLTAGIAHEIKNPLNFVNNFAALSVDLLSELKETAAPGFAALSEKQRGEIDDLSAMLTSNLEKITEHGKRADGIVKAMLEHSRGSSGERRMVDLNTLIDEALNLAYHGARAQDQSFNVTLERDFSAGIAPIEVNPQDITRVFLNIFSNGFYAANKRARSGEDGAFMPTLKVTTRDAGEAVEIRVRDNGTGIPADIRDKLFQPFFTTKPTGEGTGLGLSITYDIVTQQHGGSIAVDSKVGDYSEFTIRLPRNP